MSTSRAAVGEGSMVCMVLTKFNSVYLILVVGGGEQNMSPPPLFLSVQACLVLSLQLPIHRVLLLG